MLLIRCIYIFAIVYYGLVPASYLIKRYLYAETMPDNKNCICKGSILVTGGPGFIGSHTVVELLKENYKVVTIDNFSNCYGVENNKPESIKRVEAITGKSVTFYKADVRDKLELQKIFKLHKFVNVIHFAALKAVGESVDHPLKYYQNNIAGTATLLEVMQEYGVKSLVFSSSATVYGQPKFLPFTEDHPTGNCTNPYGKTKHGVEEILKDVCTSDPEFNVISLRYFNPVGAHESGTIGEDPSGIPNNLMPYISQVAIGRREKVMVFGNDYDTKDGTGVRDYIHITDLAVGHVCALRKILSSSFHGFKAYNLGTGQGYSVLEMIDAFSKASERNINYEIVGRREGDIASSYADPSLAKRELGWVATKGLDDMCRDTWNWQVKNPNGFKSEI